MRSLDRTASTFARLLLGAWAALACAAPSAAELARTEQAIVRGTPTSEDLAVVGLLYTAGSGRALLCTGALVAPRTVLTAAHCVDGRRPVAVALDDGEILVTRAEAHPDFDRETLHADVAVLALEQDAAVTPIPFAEDDDAPVRSGEEVRIVGLGVDRLASERAKRSGQARVGVVDASVFAIEPDPSLTCSGDSGGPAFALRDGREVLVGVASRGDWDCAVRAWHTDVRASSGFLRGAIGRAETTPEAGGCSLVPVRRPAGRPWSLVFALASAFALRRLLRFHSPKENNHELH